MDKSQIEKLVLLLVICALGVYAGYTFILEPQWNSFRRTTLETQQMQEIVTVAEQKSRHLPRVRSEMQEHDRIVTEAERSFVPGRTFDAFLAVIKDAADAAGIRLESVRPWDAGTVPYGQWYEERKVIIETQAPYHTLGKWMSELEKTSPFIRIERLTVRTHDATGAHDARIVIGFLVPQRGAL